VGRAERRARRNIAGEIETTNAADALELGCVPPGAAREVQHLLPGSHGATAAPSSARASRVAEDVVLLPEPLLEPIRHSPKMSAWKT
jgi:hypothetical protein